jgi:DNA-binding NtrC family response regulator
MRWDCAEFEQSLRTHFEIVAWQAVERVVLPLARVSDVELIPLREVQRRYVLHVLELCGGNRTDAARILGLDRKTLYRKLLRWGVNNPNHASAENANKADGADGAER